MNLFPNLAPLVFATRMPLLWLVAPDDATSRLISLHRVDIAIIAIYFAMVLGIGFYLTNLGTLELMGWAAAAY